MRKLVLFSLSITTACAVSIKSIGCYVLGNSIHQSSADTIGKITLYVIS